LLATLDPTKGSAVNDNSRAYNSVWQLRGDAWCRLEEAADRLTRPTTDGALKERYVAICQDLLTQLTPLEPYWAYPGSPQFARDPRLQARLRVSGVHGEGIEMCRPADAPITNGHRPLPAESPEPASMVDTSQPSPRKTGAKKAGKPPEPAQMG
jgi:hypothetical protein